MFKDMNPFETLYLVPGDIHPKVLIELVVELGSVFTHLFQQSLDKSEAPKEWSLVDIFLNTKR